MLYFIFFNDFISMINTDLINKSLIPIFIFFLLLLLLVPFFGTEVKGAKDG